MQELMDGLTNASQWDGHAIAPNILVVSLGDEILTPQNLAFDTGYVAYLQKQNAIRTPADVGCPLPSWSAVMAQCNTTTGHCLRCGLNRSIASAVNPGTQRNYYVR